MWHIYTHVKFNDTPFILNKISLNFPVPIGEPSLNSLKFMLVEIISGYLRSTELD